MPCRRSVAVLAVLVAVACVVRTCSAAGTGDVAEDEAAFRQRTGFSPPVPRPVHGHGGWFRAVEGFNLMDFIPQAARDLLCELALFGCPNFSVLTSTAVSASGHDAKANLLVSITSTVRMPTSLLIFFKSKADFGVTNWTLELAKDLLTGKFDGFVDMKDAAFAMGTVFRSIIEYKDVDGDAQFNPDVDVVRSTMSLLNAHWGPMTSSRVTDMSNNNTVLSLNVTTEPSLTHGQVSLQFNIATSTVNLSKMASINPNSTKIDVKIDGYMFSDAGKAAGDSLLAVKTFVLSASSKTKLNVTVDGRIEVGQEGYYDWVPVAEDGHQGLIPVAASVGDMPASDAGDLAGTVLDMVMDVSVVAKSSDLVKTVYTSFNASNPEYVYWDPSLGYDFSVPHTGSGSGPHSGPSGPAPSWLSQHWWALGVACTVGLVLMAAGVVMLRNMRLAHKNRQQFPPLVPSLSNTDSHGAVDSA